MSRPSSLSARAAAAALAVRRVLRVAVVLWAGATLAAVPDDFAEGLLLRPAGDAPLQKVELPLAVYAGTVRADLGDLRVFAPDGSEVPHALVPRAGAAPAQGFEGLPIFPLPAAAAAASGLDVRVDAAGAVVSVQGAPAAGTDSRTWLVDTGTAGPAVRELLLRFAGTGDVLGTVDIDGGATLQALGPRVRGAQLARLRHAGRTLEQLRVPLPAGSARYLRLVLSLEANGDVPAPVLTTVLGRRAADAVPAPRLAPWTTAAGGQATDGWLTFHLGARLPLQAIELDPGVDNSFVLARVECRDDERDDAAAWRSLGTMNAYRLRRGDVLRGSDPFPVPGATCARLRVRADAGTLPASARLRVAWLPADLWFLRRGDGEHLLAFGSNLAAPAPLPLAALRAEIAGAAANPAGMVGTPGEVGEVGSAAIGAARALGGSERRQATPPVDWQQVTLWGVLVLGVVLVAVLALRVLRDPAPRA